MTNHLEKLKKLWSNKFFNNYVILTTSFLILEIIFRLISNFSIFSYAGLRIFLSLSVFTLIISFILNFLPKKVASIFNPIIVLIASVYGIVELGFKNFIGVYASVSASSQAGAVTSYIWDFIRSFKPIYYILLIPFILLLIYYIFIDKKITVDLPKYKWTLNLVIVKYFQVLLIVFTFFLYFLTLKLDFMQNKMQATSTYNLFLKPNNPSLVVNDFGYIGFAFLDIKEYFFPGKEMTDNIEYNPANLSSVSTKYNENDDQIIYTEQTNINNELWKQIIASEKNNNYNNLNKYFISNKSSYTNEYTGFFENKNVIIIMVESGSPLMLNEEYYPNIAKLAKEGWSWTNYYSPRNTCSTGNNEMSNMTGLYTIYNNCTANTYKKNTYFNAIFNLFNNKGYTTSSYHDHYDQYYARDTIHINMGSEKYSNVFDLNLNHGNSYGDWASDEEFLEKYLDLLDEREDKDQPFMHWLTTVTAHQPYTDNYKYNNLYKDLYPTSYPNDVRGYMSKLKVLDNGLAKLLKGLEDRELLDDTVIVLFADHYPYGIATDKLSNAYGFDVSQDNDVERVPFIIYNPSLTPTEFTEYSEHVNTTPTIANLFNLDFDSRLYFGSDVLDHEYESLVVFDDGSWKNEYAFYDASKNNIHYYTEKVYSNEEILAINERVSLKLKMSSLAIKTDYYSYLAKKLENN